MEGLSLILLKSLVIIIAIFCLLPFLSYFERKCAAGIQNRIGPNRVGPQGLLQPLADFFKFLFKENKLPRGSRKWLYHFSPLAVFVVSLAPLAVIPICEPFYFNGAKIYPEVFHSELGFFSLLALTSLLPFCFFIAGWASNSKYSFLGALRSGTQLVSYQMVVIIITCTLFFLYQSVDLHLISQAQMGVFPIGLPEWGLFKQPLAAGIFLICLFAQARRLPFDFGEADSELCGGYQAEYSSLNYAFFKISNYIQMTVLCCFFTFLFLGGYGLLSGMGGLVSYWPEGLYVIQAVSFSVKVMALLFLFIIVRWSMPRFRYDQLMTFSWKILFPLSLINLLGTVLFSYYRSF